MGQVQVGRRGKGHPGPRRRPTACCCELQDLRLSPPAARHRPFLHLAAPLPSPPPCGPLTQEGEPAGEAGPPRWEHLPRGSGTQGAAPEPHGASDRVGSAARGPGHTHPVGPPGVPASPHEICRETCLKTQDKMWMRFHCLQSEIKLESFQVNKHLVR